MRIPTPLFVVFLAWFCTEVRGGNTPSARVNKGQPDEDMDHPWTVRIVAGKKTLCPGSLINKNFVLTAASCVHDNRPLHEYTVILGDYKIRRPEFMEYPRKIEEVLPYPTYDQRNGRNNMVLIRLAKSARFTVVVAPVQSLATQREESIHVDKEDTKCAIVGWGDQIKTENRRRKTLLLSYVDVQLVADSNCEGLDGFVSEEHVCYLSIKGGPCTDVGAPLMCRRQNRWTQVGIHAGGKNDNCRAGYYYGVAVAPFRKWIRITSQNKASTFPSNFLVTKWRTWFLMLDTNGDRTLGMGDADTSASLFASSHGLLQYGAGMAQEGYRLWYNQCALNFKAPNASMPEFINEMMKQYMTDRRGFMKRADKLCMEPYFVWMDENLDGFMTLEEFERAFISWNLLDEYHVIRLFNYLGPTNDVLPTSTAMQFFEELLTDEDKLGQSTVLRGIVLDILESRDGVLRGQRLEAERNARREARVGARGERG